MVITSVHIDVLPVLEKYWAWDLAILEASNHHAITVDVGAKLFGHDDGIILKNLAGIQRVIHAFVINFLIQFIIVD